MPYIDKKNRKFYDPEIKNIVKTLRKRNFPDGDIVYIFYKICAEWFKATERFTAINSIRGALWSTLSEFDRRIAAPYEDIKIETNGDVE